MASFAQVPLAVILSGAKDLIYQVLSALISERDRSANVRFLASLGMTI